MAETGKTHQAFLHLLHADACPPELSFSIDGALCILFDLDKDRCSYISPHIEQFTGNQESWYHGRQSRHFLKKILHPDDFHSFYVDAILSPPLKNISYEQLAEEQSYDIRDFRMRIAHRKAYWVAFHGELIRVFRNTQERPVFLLACMHLEEGKNAPPEILYEAISPREKEILQLISNGDSSKIIADKLNISSETVVSHRKNLIHKLKVKNSVELVKFALLRKLIN